MKNSRGVVLVEILIAITLAGLMLPAVYSALLTSRSGRAQGEQRLDGVSLLRQTEEELRLAAERDWSVVNVAGVYHPISAGSSFTLASGAQTVGVQSRSITLSPVYRASDGTIVLSGGTLDPSTQKAILTVSWTTPISQTLSKTIYLTRFLHNASLIQTTTSDFSSGIFANTQATSGGGGDVRLVFASASGSITDEYATASGYLFDAAKIDVVGGFAQLRNTGVTVTGSTANPGFTSNLDGWTFNSYQTNVSQTGDRVSPGGNPDAFVKLNFPKNRTVVAGGYLAHAFTTTSASSSGTLSFDWKVIDYQGSPDDFRVLAFVDTTSGAPVMGQQVWDSGLQTGTMPNWATAGPIDVSGKITTAGTYYLKLVVYLDYQNVGTNKGPYSVGFDNAGLTWSKTTNAYPSDSPAISESSSFQPVGLIAWNSFGSSEVPNGGSVTYQLSTDDAATWKYYVSGSGWLNAVTSAHSNSSAVVNTQIANLATASGKLRVRAFLNSNGTSQVKLDSVTIGYSGMNVGTQSGSFTSASIDAGQVVGWNRFSWSETNTANTTTRFQLATNTDAVTWNYVGPDGSNASYFTGGSAMIPLGSVAGRYLRYKIFFDSTTTDIPYVSDVTVNYSP